jgi:hypothetical protein
MSGCSAEEYRRRVLACSEQLHVTGQVSDVRNIFLELPDNGIARYLTVSF